MKHTHRYQKVNISQTPGKKYEVMKCSLPDCTHYVIPILAIGKKSMCWSCAEEFKLNSTSIRMAKPTCGCRSAKKQKAKKLDVDVDLLNTMLKELI